MFTAIEGFKTRKKDVIYPNVWQMDCSVCFLLASCKAYFSTLKKVATWSSETSVEFQLATRRYIPEDGIIPKDRLHNEPNKRVLRSTGVHNITSILQHSVANILKLFLKYYAMIIWLYVRVVGYISVLFTKQIFMLHTGVLSQ